MPNLLFIAEKPSLAEAIARARGTILGVRPSKGPKAWTVGDDAVTWLFGHMYELANPDEYDARFKQWRIDDLPILPDRWRRVPHKDKADHLSAIKALLKSSKTVVNAGDAEREGQLLVDELLEEMGWDPFSASTKRIWVSSMAEKDMVAAINSIFPNADKRNLSVAAVLRQRADWLHGLNMTRLYTILARRSGADMLISVGRVQTPTLKLVVDRDREIEKFKPTDHYLPNGLFRHANGTFRADWIIPDDHEGLDHEGRLVDRKVADAIAAKIAGKTGKVESFASTPKTKAPPLPYSLSALQQECSTKLGLTAQQTLEVAQALYETHKATTYPRSDSRHLPTTILKEEAPGIMQALKAAPGIGDAAQKADMKIRSKAWDDSKVTDHHGIIPTSEFTAAKLERMSPVERRVFEMIAKAFVAQFYPDFAWKSLTAIVQVEGERFKGTGRQVTAQGWKAVYGAEEADDEDDKEADQAVPTMAKGDPVTAEKGEVASKRTQPPAYFTDGTLIAAMTNVHKFVTDPEVKKRLKENDGIGTEATRASIIETLLKRKFLERKGKTKLMSTQQGRSVIDALPEDVTSPGMTAIWEAQLSKIARGEADPQNFTDILVKTLSRTIMRGKESSVTIKGASIEPLEGHGQTCPKCGKGQLLTRVVQKGEQKGKRFLSCNAWKKDDPNSCDYSAWPESGPRKPVKPMEGDGQQCPKCGKGRLVTRAIGKGDNKGKTFLSCDNWRKGDPMSCDYVKWPEDKVKPMDGHGAQCPQCGKGTMVTKLIGKGDNKGKTFLSCNAYPECKHSVFPDSTRGDRRPNGSPKAPTLGLAGLSRKPGRR